MNKAWVLLLYGKICDGSNAATKQGCIDKYFGENWKTLEELCEHTFARIAVIPEGCKVCRKTAYGAIDPGVQHMVKWVPV